jgi:hypothetical protein
MIDELERIWKQAVMVLLRYYHGISLEGLRKTTKALSQDSWWPSSDVNQTFPRHKSRVLPLDKPVHYAPLSSDQLCSQMII